MDSNVINECDGRYRVVIAGSRSFNDYDVLKSACDDLLQEKSLKKGIVIISGGAKGADTLGERYARDRGYEVRRYPADWGEYGKAAGHVRNTRMARQADALIAFWDGRSKGTGDMISQARKNRLDVIIISTGKINESY